MSDKVRAKLILERWLVGIKRDDKRHENMPSLFDSLASQLFAAGIEFDVAYELMKLGSKHMYPVAETIKYVFSRSTAKKFANIQEFTKSWHESLDKTALNAFYTYYDIEGSDPSKISAVKKASTVKQESAGMVTEDELNEEDFWKSTRTVSKTNPWLFNDEDQAQ